MLLVHFFYAPATWNSVLADIANLSGLLGHGEKCIIGQIFTFTFTENIPSRAKGPHSRSVLPSLQAVVTVRSPGTCRSSPCHVVGCV